MWLNDYGKSPGEVDRMTMNDVYTILYSRAARRINRRFSEAIKSANPITDDVHSRFGE